MYAEYTALELARGAGFVIRPVAEGGARPLFLEDGRVRILELGPEATDETIRALACTYLEPEPHPERPDLAYTDRRCAYLVDASIFVG